MQSLSHHLRSFGGATLDVALAVFGVLLVLVPTAGTLHDLLGSPLPAAWIELAAVPVAVVVAYPFVTRRFSLGWLGTYVLAFVAGTIAVGLVGAAVVIGLGIELSGSDPRPKASLVLLGHVVALVVAHLNGERLRGPVAE